MTTCRRSGDLVLVDVVGQLEDGTVFLDTRELGAPLAFQVGIANKCKCCRRGSRGGEHVAGVVRGLMPGQPSLIKTSSDVPFI
jgi:hypothetical protein